jgi:hypothetical protein
VRNGNHHDEHRRIGSDRAVGEAADPHLRERCLAAAGVVHGAGAKAAAGQRAVHGGDVGALSIEVHHLPVVVLQLVRHDHAAGSRVCLPADDVLVEQRFEALVIDSIWPRHHRRQGQFALRFA